MYSDFFEEWEKSEEQSNALISIALVHIISMLYQISVLVYSKTILGSMQNYASATRYFLHSWNAVREIMRNKNAMISWALGMLYLRYHAWWKYIQNSDRKISNSEKQVITRLQWLRWMVWRRAMITWYRAVRMPRAFPIRLADVSVHRRRVAWEKRSKTGCCVYNDRGLHRK